MCTLSNINKMAYFYAACKCVLLNLVLAGNSAQFQIYTLLLKSPNLMHSLPLLCYVHAQ